ncbi:unnamed protein product [Penicillium salamii]|nr:unnamed protein product [Penicillium salamii]CAG8429626.1 unnamed protein product [Penicillium salamii]
MNHTGLHSLKVRALNPHINAVLTNTTVRAVVPETDDPTIPVNTLRMWLLGIVFTILGSGINQFFGLRYPSVHIVSLVAELLAYPLGVFLAKTLPLTSIRLGPPGDTCHQSRQIIQHQRACIDCDYE